MFLHQNTSKRVASSAFRSQREVVVAFVCLMFVMSLVTSAHAQSGGASAKGKTLPTSTVPASGTTGAADEPGSENKSDRLDVTDIERKYWAAKDTDFSVVQNRTYSKAGRFALSAAYGVMVNDPYSEAINLSGTMNYYFSERMGLEINYTQSNPNNNKSVESYKTLDGAVFPSHGKVMSFYGAYLNWVPFYAKMSVLNSKIIYFDMAFSPGVGMTQYEAQILSGPVKKSSPTLAFDVSQHFFISKNLAFRVDYKNRWFQEEIYFGSGVAMGQKVKTEMTQTSSLLFGATVFF